MRRPGRPISCGGGEAVAVAFLFSLLVIFTSEEAARRPPKRDREEKSPILAGLLKKYRKEKKR